MVFAPVPKRRSRHGRWSRKKPSSALSCLNSGLLTHRSARHDTEPQSRAQGEVANLREGATVWRMREVRKHLDCRISGPGSRRFLATGPSSPPKLFAKIQVRDAREARPSIWGKARWVAEPDGAFVVNEAYDKKAAQPLRGEREILLDSANLLIFCLLANQPHLQPHASRLHLTPPPHASTSRLSFFYEVPLASNLTLLALQPARALPRAKECPNTDQKCSVLRAPPQG